MQLPDLHMHTYRCKHAQGNVEDYAAEAYARGLKRIIFTDHGPLGGFDPGNRMSLSELPAYIDDVTQCARNWNGKLDVGMGLEMDWVEELEAFNRRLADAADWDILLGSVHFVGPAPQHKFIIRRSPGEEAEIVEAYWKHWADAASSGLFQVMSHPDIYRSIRRDPLPLELDCAKRALDVAAKAGVALECNTSLLRKGGGSFYPQDWLLEEVLERGMMLTSASDAHRPHQVGADFSVLDALAATDPRARFTDFRSRRPASLSSSFQG